MRHDFADDVNLTPLPYPCVRSSHTKPLKAQSGNLRPPLHRPAPPHHEPESAYVLGPGAWVSLCPGLVKVKVPAGRITSPHTRTPCTRGLQKLPPPTTRRGSSTPHQQDAVSTAHLFASKSVARPTPSLATNEVRLVHLLLLHHPFTRRFASSHAAWRAPAAAAATAAVATMGAGPCAAGTGRGCMAGSFGPTRRARPLSACSPCLTATMKATGPPPHRSRPQQRRSRPPQGAARRGWWAMSSLRPRPEPCRRRCRLRTCARRSCCSSCRTCPGRRAFVRGVRGVCMHAAHAWSTARGCRVCVTTSCLAPHLPSAVFVPFRCVFVQPRGVTVTVP